jgi:peroxidase
MNLRAGVRTTSEYRVMAQRKSGLKAIEAWQDENMALWLPVLSELAASNPQPLSAALERTVHTAAAPLDTMAGEPAVTSPAPVSSAPAATAAASLVNPLSSPPLVNDPAAAHDDGLAPAAATLQLHGTAIASTHPANAPDAAGSSDFARGQAFHQQAFHQQAFHPVDFSGAHNHDFSRPTLGHQATPEYRSIDGSGNNLANTEFNSAGSDFTRAGPAHFADGVSMPVDGPNPRMISNVVVGEGNADQANAEGLSGMMYAWGQFIDHDLDLANADGVTHIDIPVPNGDPVFGDGSVIALTRAIVDPATGPGTGKPATAVNAITGWLDGSMVYGSDAATAASLRLADGHMKTSEGNNLPIENGQFLAGDVRAQENPSLTALQTLFLREHNYQVDQLKAAHPDWSGDQLYDQARAIVSAEIANITYSEFLPHLLGPNAIPAYKGYDPSVDPRITEEFAGAAFRFGHSIVSAETERIDENGAVVGPSLELAQTFFMTPADFTAASGADGFLRHLASDPSQAMDARIVDDLRNFLVDPPDGMDLAAINIQRGRDLGLGTLNQTREALGLKPYTDFSQVSDDPATVKALEQAFGSVDKIDLWTGGLSEAHMAGAMVGETFGTIIANQFTALRDGDRLYFENAGFDPKTLGMIEGTTLADIIKRDTDTKNIQDDVFVFAERHSGTAGGVAGEEPDVPQVVVGANGNDTLSGGPKADFLFAGTGTQVLVGGDGADTFEFKFGTRATITDFQPGIDKLVVEGLDLGHARPGQGGRFGHTEVQVHNHDGSAVIDVGSVHIELTGVKPSQITDLEHLFS